MRSSMRRWSLFATLITTHDHCAGLARDRGQSFGGGITLGDRVVVVDEEKHAHHLHRVSADFHQRQKLFHHDAAAVRTAEYVRDSHCCVLLSVRNRSCSTVRLSAYIIRIRIRKAFLDPMACRFHRHLANCNALARIARRHCALQCAPLPGATACLARRLHCRGALLSGRGRPPIQKKRAPFRGALQSTSLG
jgi:hypothetical protein